MQNDTVTHKEWIKEHAKNNETKHNKIIQQYQEFFTKPG